MDPVFLQKQLRENSADLNSFYNELKQWGEEMKRKENADKGVPAETTKKSKQKAPKKVTFNNQPTKIPTKVGSTDYGAWDKFDADAECEKVDYDENEDSDLTDECDENAREEAYLQKEKGNKFVKNQQWDEAISCYTKAIEYYNLDPIFFANRALCYLKKKDFTNAETDCSLALRLDGSYTKALYRRAMAREALNKLQEAEEDLLKSLKFEPDNKETKQLLSTIKEKVSVQRPVSKFTASRNNMRKPATQIVETVQKNIQKQIDSSKPICYWPSGDDDIIPVRTINKPVHMRSQKPLKRIEIKLVDSLANSAVVDEPKAVQPLQITSTLKTDDLKVVERKPAEISKETKNIVNENVANFVAPKTSVQFGETWRFIRNLEDKYKYIKLIQAKNLSRIFKESMEYNVFSGIIQVLAEYFIKNSDGVWDWLVGFTEIKRFSTFTMFLSDKDKKYLWKLFDYVKESEQKPKEEVDLLIKKYEL